MNAVAEPPVGATRAKEEVPWSKDPLMPPTCRHCLPSTTTTAESFFAQLGFLGKETWCWVRWLGQGPQLGTIGAKGRRVVFHRSGQPPLIWGGPAPWRPPCWYPGQWLWSEGLKYTSPTSANPRNPSKSVQLWTGWANVGRCAWAGCNYAGSLTPQPLLDNTPTVTEHDKKHNNLASYMYPPKYGISFVGTAIPKTHAQ